MMKANLYHLYKKKKIWGILIVHLLVVATGYLLLDYLGYVNTIINDNNVLNWDAYWFSSIKNTGYVFIPDRTCNLAFFPLFPMLWKLTTVSSIGICLVNASIFALGFFLLLKDCNMPGIFYLFILALPTSVFFGLPYSESLFFLCAAIIIIGYKTHSVFIKCVGFFFASLTKSASSIFIPAIIIAQVFSIGDKQKTRQTIAYIILDILSSLAGLAFATIIQAQQTRKWFYYLEIQRFWRRHWIIAKFPFTTYRPQDILGIDGAAFVLGIIAIFYCFRWFYQLNLSKVKYIPVVDRATIFSTLIIAATTILDTFFTFNMQEATSIWSINRHILCSPFAIVFLIWIYNNLGKSITEIWIVAIIICVCVYITGVFKYPLMLAYYCTFFLFLVGIKVFRYHRYYFAVVYLACVIVQIITFHEFLNNKWIG